MALVKVTNTVPYSHQGGVGAFPRWKTQQTQAPGEAGTATSVWRPEKVRVAGEAREEEKGFKMLPPFTFSQVAIQGKH